ncbi:MAG TPA: oxalate:formate antiporter [Gammaproteobacteria bacterium]|nr:oxalate:formate antiporter [Gammaproteobacteria bacterium]
MAGNQQTASGSDTPAAQIAAVWAIVLIPLAWGFIETVIKAAQLFQ